MKQRVVPAILALLLAAPAHAMSPSPTAPAAPVTEAVMADTPQTPYSESRMRIDGFDGMLMITPDADWREKWDTPPDTVPRFNISHEVSEGGQLWILPFFSNPRGDAEGQANVTCDIVVVRPDGSLSQSLLDAECMRGPLPPQPTNVFLAKQLLGFMAEPSDLRGRWIVKVTLRDKVRGVELPLQTWFDVK
jgi:hypothetical protein